MTRKIKLLGLALMATLALNAVPASPAHALSFTSANYPATISGVTVSEAAEFEFDIGTLECEETFTGSLTSAASTLTLTPSYSECIAAGLLPASVDMNGCTYLFHASGLSDAWFDVVCPGKSQIAVTIPAVKCTITIGPQTAISTFALKQSGNHVNLELNVGGIVYTYDQTEEKGCGGQSGLRTGGIHRSTVTLAGNNGKLSFD